VITLTDKNSKVIKAVVILVFVLMVDYMPLLEGEVLSNNLSGKTTRMPVGDVRRSCSKPGMPAIGTAEVMVVLPHLPSGAGDDGPASGAGYRHLMLASIHPGLSKQLIDALPGDTVLCGKVLSPGHLHLVGMHYVNLVTLGQSDSFLHSFHLHDLMP